MMKSLRDKIADIIWSATDNYEMGAEPTCGSVADAIIDCIKLHGGENMLYTYQELINMPMTARNKGDNDNPRNEEWHPAKPVHVDSLAKRLKAAWYVLTNRAIAVRWY